jgi:hypothetical protein
MEARPLPLPINPRMKLQEPNPNNRAGGLQLEYGSWNFFSRGLREGSFLDGKFDRPFANNLHLGQGILFLS